MFDADKLGKDKSLGKVEINPRDFDGVEAKWFPLKGVKSGEVLVNADILAPGQSALGLGANGKRRPIRGKLLEIELYRFKFNQKEKSMNFMEAIQPIMFYMDLIHQRNNLIQSGA